MSRTDSNINDEAAGIARIQLAKESKARYAREAELLASQNQALINKITKTKAAEDDDIMDEEAGRMRIQLAKDSHDRKAAEAAALKALNDEMLRRVASTKAAYLTNAGSATPYTLGAEGKSQPKAIPPVEKTIPTKGHQSPSQQHRRQFYPIFGKENPVQAA